MSQIELLSDDPITMAAGLNTAVTADYGSKAKIQARQGVEYYAGNHNILKNRIFYMNEDGEAVEDKYASNIRIPHQFFTELTDQEVQYLLSNPIEIEVDDEAKDGAFEDYLKEYYDDQDFHLSLQEALEGAIKKGFEYIYARTTDQDVLKFQVADSLCAFPVYDENNEVKRICRYYEKEINDGSQTHIVKHAEIWDDSKVWFFKTAKDSQNFMLDTSRGGLNPRPHIVAQMAAEEGAEDDQLTLAGRTYGTIPFYRLQNNLEERSGLAPIKALIDDYDLMNAFLSNNLQDFTDAIYVVTGFKGDNLDELRLNLRAKKTIGVPEGGGLEVKTVQIPVEGRKAKMDLDKENIYRFGMGFDSTQIGDGNLTNIVIKARYTLLNMKANKVEARMQSMLKWINELVTADINRKNGTAFDPKVVKFKFIREVPVNDMDQVNIDKLKADTRQVVVQSILAAAPRLDDESVLKLICEQFDLDWEEIQKQIDDNNYQDITTGTDPNVLPGVPEQTQPAEPTDPTQTV